jgi:hypothetical protein
MAKYLFHLAIILALFSSCKKEIGVPGAAGPPGNSGTDGNQLDTGTIYGNLVVYNEFSWPMSDSSGVTVSLNVGSKVHTTTSDASGNYYFHGLQSGTYNLTYQKSGFGTMKVFGISHSPGSSLNTQVSEIYILQNPIKTAVDSITVSEAYSYVIVRIFLDTSSYSYTQYQYNFVLLVGKDPNLTQANATYSPYNQFISPDGQGTYTVIVDRGQLGGNDHAGGTYYLTVGTCNRWIRGFANPDPLFDTGLSGYYIDPIDGKYVYPNLKLSPNTITIQ